MRKPASTWLSVSDDTKSPYDAHAVAGAARVPGSPRRAASGRTAARDRPTRDRAPSRAISSVDDDEAGGELRRDDRAVGAPDT